MFNALIQHGAVQQHEGWIALLNTGELVFENAAYTGIAMDNADSYFQARMATSVLNQTREEHFQGIGTVLEAQGLIQITWVSQFGVVYHDMQPLSAQWVHTSQRQLNDLYTP